MPNHFAFSLAIAGAITVVASPSARAIEAERQLAPLGVDKAVIAAPADDSLAGYYLAARHASVNKDLSAAAGFFARALEKDPDNARLLDRATLLSVASGNVTKAAELATDLLAIRPRDQVALITRAVASLRNGDTEAAQATLDELSALGRPLQELIAGLLKAWSVAMEGDPAKAVSMLDDLEGPSWYQAFTKRHAGLIAEGAGLSSIARDRLSLAYERDPGALKVMDAYARTLARAGDTERALKVVERFEDRIGGNQSLTRALRDAIGQGEVAPQVATPREGAAEVLHDIATAIGTDGSNQTFTASLLQLSLHLAPDTYLAAMTLGSVLESMEQHEAAIAVYRAIDRDSALLRNAQVQEALNLSILERYDEAIAILKELVANDPSDVGTAVALGNVYRNQEMFEEAEQVYSAAIEALDGVPPAYWTLYYYRGIAYERTDRWDRAEADFKTALELEPEQPLVLNYLGYSWIDRGENLDEAIEMVRRAVEQRPEDGYIVDSLGWAYYRLNAFDKAVTELERAVELKPRDPVINDHLGDAYWRVGRKLEATFQWSHALSNDPEDDRAEDIKAKLESGLDAVERDAAATARAAATPDPVAEPR